MALFDFGKVKATISALAGELKALRGERETLLQARETLEGQPACKEDLLAMLDTWIDRVGSGFPKRLEAALNYYRRHPLATLPEDPKAAARPLGVLNATVQPNEIATVHALEASLFFVLRDPIRSGIHAAVETLDFSDCGPPRAERLETIKAIDARIDALDKAEQELISQAEQSGLRL